MTDLAIHVDGLGKRYRLGTRERYRALRDTLARAAGTPLRVVRRLAGRAQPPAEPPGSFWALKDVSFDVRSGDVVGVIGRNGAGKSTLLKILSRITAPTAGRVDLFGRVGSLLEVGTGFHPELSGRENVFLNGAVLGMSRREIARKFDEIVAFAEVAQFLDTAVKHYSSGMYMRLAFAVAAHLEPEILLVDEVLAVGDAGFQRKCLGKMEDAARGGRTVLFVSHNMSVIQQFCTRAVLMHRGAVVKDATTHECIRTYLHDAAFANALDRPAHPSGQPTLVGGRLGPDDVDPERAVSIELEIATGKATWVSVDLRLSDGTANPVGFGSLGALDERQVVTLTAGVNRIAVRLPTDRLATGSYYVSLDLTHPNICFFDRVEHCFQFDVTRAPAPGVTRVLPQAWGYGSYELALERVS